ncbi:MAG: SPOR domain-containing protein [Pseudomonadota bacterium]|nr:SPOR domain-containing protein [Pseudomonadota bacterium]
MPFFKFRRGDASSGPPSGFAAQVESVEVMRKRARHRLIGASVLVLLGVVGFPLLFDTQPRPVPVDIPIEIPGKNAVKPLVVPTPAPSAAPAEKVSTKPGAEEEFVPSRPGALTAPAPSAVKKEDRPEPGRQARAPSRPEIKPDPPTEERAPARPAAKPPEARLALRKPADADAESPRAAALLSSEGIPPLTKPATPEAKSRTVLQVGAFADSAKADETRFKLEKAGLKTYTQIVDTKDGKRIRVRVGPFATKAEAEKATGKIRSLDLPIAILTF